MNTPTPEAVREAVEYLQKHEGFSDVWLHNHYVKQHIKTLLSAYQDEKEILDCYEKNADKIHYIGHDKSWYVYNDGQHLTLRSAIDTLRGKEKG